MFILLPHFTEPSLINRKNPTRTFFCNAMANPSILTTIHYFLAFALSTALAIKSYKKKKLTQGGAIAAFTCGVVEFSLNPFQGGGYLLAFYFLGMKASRYKNEYKKSLVFETSEQDCEGEKTTEKIPTPREANNVFSTAGPALLLTLYTCCITPKPLTTLYGTMTPLHLAIISCYATSLGDTLASEIGVALGSKFRLSEGEDKCHRTTRLVVPPFRKVPSGTNGGVSVFGTFASCIGGGVIGFLAGIVGLVDGGRRFGGGECLKEFFALLVFGVGCGFFGSMLDSFLGALCQVSYYDGKRDVIIENHSSKEKKNDDIVRVTGYNLLSNCNVNLLSVSIMTFGVYLLCPN